MKSIYRELVSFIAGIGLASGTALGNPVSIEGRMKMPTPEGELIKREIVPLSRNINFINRINPEASSIERKFRLDYYGNDGNVESIFAYFSCNNGEDKYPAAAFFLGENHVAYFDTGVKGIPDGYIDHTDFDFTKLYHPRLSRFICYEKSEPDTKIVSSK